MTAQASSKVLLRALRGECLTPPPIWLMRQAGRYLPEYRKLRAQAANFLEFCYTPSLAVEATLQPIRRFDFDAAIIFSDILVIPDALGRKVEFREGEGPVLGPLEESDALPELDPAQFVRHLAPVYQALTATAAALPPGKTLIGFAGAPWTLACYMVDGRNRQDRFARTRRFAANQPQRFAALIATLADAVILHCRNQIDAGAEAIQLFDSWAEILIDGDDSEMLQRHSLVPMERIAAALRHYRPDVPVIAFPRGVGRHVERYGDCGFAGLSIDGSIERDWAAQTLRGKVTIQGMLDNAVLVEGGDALRRETRAILDAFAGSAFVFNLAHGVLPPTPPENVAELVELVRQGKRP